MTFEDHRVHPRANLKWTVSLELGGKLTEAVTKDISEGGAYVCCPSPLGPKEEFSMVINAPEKQLNVTAEVVWANAYGADEEITPTGMGVRFMNITNEDRRLLLVTSPTIKWLKIQQLRCWIPWKSNNLTFPCWLFRSFPFCPLLMFLTTFICTPKEY
jgi:Tfp pilus assembly protein PilZ